MIRILAGLTGEGKTKILIEMANDLIKATKGHLVYIDEDDSHIYDLHHNIRFIKSKEYPISDYREFIGFICGILSQDTDIHVIYIDAIFKIVKFKNDSEVELFIENLNKLYETFDVDFVLSMSKSAEELPEKIQKYLTL